MNWQAVQAPLSETWCVVSTTTDETCGAGLTETEARQLANQLNRERPILRTFLTD